MKVENTPSSCFELCFDSKTEELKTNRSHNHPKNYYIFTDSTLANYVMNYDYSYTWKKKTDTFCENEFNKM